VRAKRAIPTARQTDFSISPPPIPCIPAKSIGSG
jgi:hypothetical protein